MTGRRRRRSASSSGAWGSAAWRARSPPRRSSAGYPRGITITGCMWIWAVLLALIAAVRPRGGCARSWPRSASSARPRNVSVQTYRMQITPNELLGRTSSVALQIGWGVIPLGSLLAGILLQALRAAAAMSVVAAGMRHHGRRGDRARADPRRGHAAELRPPSSGHRLRPPEPRSRRRRPGRAGAAGRRTSAPPAAGHRNARGTRWPRPGWPAARRRQAPGIGSLLVVQHPRDRQQRTAEAGSPSRIAAAFRATARPSVPASSSLCITGRRRGQLMSPLPSSHTWLSRLRYP